jgi:Fic family protein
MLTKGIRVPECSHLQVSLQNLAHHRCIVEVHLFADGNGCIARIAMNAELAAADVVRILVPTVYRNNYLAGLKGATNNASSCH